jgi:hypothetical protein
MSVDEIPWPIAVVIFTWVVLLIAEVLSAHRYPGKSERERYWLSTIVRGSQWPIRVGFIVQLGFTVLEEEWETFLPLALSAAAHEGFLRLMKRTGGAGRGTPLGNDYWTSLSRKRMAAALRRPSLPPAHSTPASTKPTPAKKNLPWRRSTNRR